MEAAAKEALEEAECLRHAEEAAFLDDGSQRSQTAPQTSTPVVEATKKASVIDRATMEAWAQGPTLRGHAANRYVRTLSGMLVDKTCDLALEDAKLRKKMMATETLPTSKHDVAKMDKLVAEKQHVAYHALPTPYRLNVPLIVPIELAARDKFKLRKFFQVSWVAWSAA